MRMFSLRSFLICLWVLSLALGACGTRKPASSEEEEAKGKLGQNSGNYDPGKSQPPSMGNNTNSGFTPSGGSGPSTSNNPSSQTPPSGNMGSNTGNSGGSGGTGFSTGPSPNSFGGQTPSSSPSGGGNTGYGNLYKMNAGYCYEFSGSGITANDLASFPGDVAQSGSCPSSSSIQGHTLYQISSCASVQKTLNGISATVIVRLYDKVIKNGAIFIRGKDKAESECDQLSRDLVAL